MSKQITVALAGLGNRGGCVYAPAAKIFPEKMKIVAIADVDPKKVEQIRKEYDVPEENCFKSAEEMLEKPKLADVMIITTQDRQHVGHAIPALEKGYDLLLEKPISPEIEQCRKIVEVARKYNREVVVCHVLRYTPIYQKVKEILDSGKIGDVVSIMAVENVGWFHQAHSFVRGNWSNSDKTSPMILQKCCHDMDLYLWLAGKKCKSLSSFGNTYLFKEEKAPKGCVMRCMDGCKARQDCPFDAEKIYFENKMVGYHRGNRQWPLEVLTANPTEQSLKDALEHGPYGRCVYHCDNNVVDHQVVNLNMEDGSTMSFTMNGFSAGISRYAKFMGTKGEMIVNMDNHSLEENKIIIRLFDENVTEETIDVSSLSDDFSGHGGGDLRMVEEFLDVIGGEKTESAYVTSLEHSVESHYCALAAEESRIKDGQVIEIEKYRKEM